MQQLLFNTKDCSMSQSRIQAGVTDSTHLLQKLEKRKKKNMRKLSHSF